MKKLAFLMIAVAGSFTNITAQSIVQSNDALSSIAQNLESNQGVTQDNFIQYLQVQYNLQPEINFEKLSSSTDALGATHTKYNQTYKNIAIVGSQIVIHQKNNSVYYINGNISHTTNLATIPTISEAEAIEVAKNNVRYKSYSWENKAMQKMILAKNKNANFYPTPKLSIIDANGNGEFVLCWQFEITSGDLSQTYQVFIDATTRNFIKKLQRTNTDVACSGPTWYNGNRTFKGYLDANTNSYIYFTESSYGPNLNQEIETISLNFDPTFNSISEIYNPSTTFTTDTIANSVHWGMERTYNFYFDKFNRNSFDDAGTSITNLTHVEPDLNNASWLGDQFGSGVMRYGDGDGTDYNPFVNIDVAGHELSHGVTQYSANLDYEGESGALNESFSDIMAVGVEEYALGSAYNWKIGEGINRSGISHLRNMENPKNTQGGYQQPDTYKGSFWINQVGCIPSSTNDLCGVHVNSGVGNYWFFMLAMGDSATNDKGYKYAFPGIGLDKALKIVYKMQTEFLTTTSKYAEAVVSSTQVATDLYGAGSNEVTIVKQAWCAVNLGSNCMPLSTADFKSIVKPSVYPNPSNGFITIKNIYDTYSYQISNAMGALVAKGLVSENNNSINLEQYGAGIYNLQLINNGNIVNVKVAVQ